jgi:hypothetical protein
MQTCQLGENHVTCNTGGRNATCIHNVCQEFKREGATLLKKEHVEGGIVLNFKSVNTA